MPTRTTLRQAADERTRNALALVARELRSTRRQHGLSQLTVAEASRTSRSKVSRVELGRDPGLSIGDAMAMLAAVGLDLSVRTYPGGRPARDSAHTALLGRLRSRLHAALGWRTEVPLPVDGDRRAWDALISGDGWQFGVEAETHPDDRQALERKVALKVRDSRVSGVIVVLARTAANRRFVEANAAELRGAFPAEARGTLAALASGRRPPGDALLLL
jgi:transcriptional regulator with XRE-family HTH domain